MTCGTARLTWHGKRDCKSKSQHADGPCGMPHHHQQLDCRACRSLHLNALCQVVRQHRAAAQEQRRVHRGGPGGGTVVAKVLRLGLRLIPLGGGAAAAGRGAAAASPRSGRQEVSSICAIRRSQLISTQSTNPVHRSEAAHSMCLAPPWSAGGTECGAAGLGYSSSVIVRGSEMTASCNPLRL